MFSVSKNLTLANIGEKAISNENNFLYSHTKLAFYKLRVCDEMKVRMAESVRGREKDGK